MSDIEFFATNKLKITSTEGREDLRRLDLQLVKKDGKDVSFLPARTNTITALGFIPNDILSSLGKRISEVDSKEDLEGQYNLDQSVQAKHFDDFNAFSAALDKNIFKVRDTYYAYYISLLRTANQFLKHPNIPVTLRSKSNSNISSKLVHKVLTLRTGNVAGATHLKLPSVQVEVKQTWPVLTEYTLRKKEERASNTYWHHRGEGSNAFDSHISNIAAKIKPTNMAKSTSTPILKNESAKRGVAALSYKYNITIPNVEPRIDAMLGIPLMTGVSPGVKGLAQESPSILNANPSATGLNKESSVHGLDRIVLAEARRPFLRPLALAARTQLHKTLASYETSRSNNPIQDQIRFNKATEAALLAKAKQEANRIKAENKAKEDAIAKAGKLRRAEERAATKLENAKKKSAPVHPTKEDLTPKHATVSTKTPLELFKESLQKADKQTSKILTRPGVKPPAKAAAQNKGIKPKTIESYKKEAATYLKESEAIMAKMAVADAKGHDIAPLMVQLNTAHENYQKAINRISKLDALKQNTKK